MPPRLLPHEGRACSKVSREVSSGLGDREEGPWNRRWLAGRRALLEGTRVLRQLRDGCVKYGTDWSEIEERVRCQLGAQKDFPRVGLSATGVGSAESSEQPVPGRMQAEGRLSFLFSTLSSLSFLPGLRRLCFQLPIRLKRKTLQTTSLDDFVQIQLCFKVLGRPSCLRPSVPKSGEGELGLREQVAHRVLGTHGLTSSPRRTVTTLCGRGGHVSERFIHCVGKTRIQTSFC